MNFLGVSKFHGEENISINHLLQDVEKSNLLSFELEYAKLLFWDDVYTNTDRPLYFTDKNYLFIGKAFQKRSNSLVSKIDFNNIASVSPNYFLEEFYGDYLLIRCHDRTFSILRAPSAQLPLFYILREGVIVFSNKIQILNDIFKYNLCFNWRYLSNYLLYGNLLTTSSPFENCFELPMGCLLETDAKKLDISLAWNPIAYTYNMHGENPEKLLINHLQQTLMSSLESIEDLFLEFSGGVDSTAILYCLKNICKSSQSLTALHFYNPESAAANEFELARKICDSIEVKLVAMNFLDVLPFAQIKMPFKPDKPSTFLIFQKQEKMLAEYVRDCKSYKFISGHGGDDLLLVPPPLELLNDYIEEIGLKGVYAQMLDLFAYYRIPLIGLVKNILKFKYFPSRNQETAFAPWINKDVLKYKFNYLRHPFFDKKQKILPGKARQIESIYNALTILNLNVRSPGNYVFFPYLSQLMLEKLLPIPAYKFFDHGYDRYPIRKGISDLFKTDFIWRKNKGEMTSVLQFGLKQNLNDILKLCLEGEFAQRGLIDKDLLHRDILSMCQGKMDGQWFIVQLIVLEMFFEYWGGSTR